MRTRHSLIPKTGEQLRSLLTEWLCPSDVSDCVSRNEAHRSLTSMKSFGRGPGKALLPRKDFPGITLVKRSGIVGPDARPDLPASNPVERLDLVKEVWLQALDPLHVVVRI